MDGGDSVSSLLPSSVCWQSHTDLHPVGFPEAHADAGSKGPSWDAADHHRHALLTRQVAFHLYLSAHLAVRQVSLVAGAVDREAPIILLASVSQQSEKIQQKSIICELTALGKKHKFIYHKTHQRLWKDFHILGTRRHECA